MLTSTTCTVGVYHKNGERLDVAPFGREPGWRTRSARCGDCGVARGGWHHPGCDIQCCPLCGGQMIKCGCRFDEDPPDDDDVDFDELRRRPRQVLRSQ